MRDPKRIPGVLAVIEDLWRNMPDLRFMQLLINAVGEKTYYLEDHDLVSRIEKYAEDCGIVLG